MSDDEVVASDVPPRYLLFLSFSFTQTNPHPHADGKSYGACYGDSGGPLVVKQPHGFVVVGVAHFAATPYCLTLPSGYYRVEPFLDWIHATMKQ